MEFKVGDKVKCIGTKCHYNGDCDNEYDKKTLLSWTDMTIDHFDYSHQVWCKSNLFDGLRFFLETDLELIKGMTFIEAVAEMEKGSRLRRKQWPENLNVFRQDIGTEFITSSGSKCEFNLYDFKANDWEIIYEVGIWNLAENSWRPVDNGIEKHPAGGLFVMEDVIKCQATLWERIEQRTKGTGTKMDEFVYLGDIEEEIKRTFGEFK